MKSWGNLPFHFNCCISGINYFYMSPLEIKQQSSLSLQRHASISLLSILLFHIHVCINVLETVLKNYLGYLYHAGFQQCLKLYGKCLVLHSTWLLLGAYIVLSNYSWHFTYPTVSVFRGDRQKASATALRFLSNCAPCQGVQCDARYKQ